MTCPWQDACRGPWFFLLTQPSPCWANPSRDCCLAHWAEGGGKDRDFGLRQTPWESSLYHYWLRGLGQVFKLLSLSFLHLCAEESSTYGLHCFKDSVRFHACSTWPSASSCSLKWQMLVTLALIFRFVAILDTSAQPWLSLNPWVVPERGPRALSRREAPDPRGAEQALPTVSKLVHGSDCSAEIFGDSLV